LLEHRTFGDMGSFFFPCSLSAELTCNKNIAFPPSPRYRCQCTNPVSFFLNFSGVSPFFFFVRFPPPRISDNFPRGPCEEGVWSPFSSKNCTSRILSCLSLPFPLVGLCFYGWNLRGQFSPATRDVNFPERDYVSFTCCFF